ncbi:hypothetical protein KPH14_011872 [Odynerus spinipes]|uniref:CCHC-type domain-containing protein n=1 Tax=Odynerus spinipes TaxID=1348599 RepID=A0AAD9RER2_9HYME|nr:hypothetical protein KPH14_011872 [Odynerus spinipes]
MLLNSLPTQYETFCIAIESRETMPTLEELKVKLWEEEIRKADDDPARGTGKETALLSNKKNFQERRPQGESTSNQRPGNAYHKRQNGRCYVCGKMGHIARFCKSKQGFAAA